MIPVLLFLLIISYLLWENRDLLLGFKWAFGESIYFKIFTEGLFYLCIIGIFFDIYLLLGHHKKSKNDSNSILNNLSELNNKIKKQEFEIDEIISIEIDCLKKDLKKETDKTPENTSPLADVPLVAKTQPYIAKKEKFAEEEFDDEIPF